MKEYRVLGPERQIIVGEHNHGSHAWNVTAWKVIHCHLDSFSDFDSILIVIRKSPRSVAICIISPFLSSFSNY